MKNKLFVIGLLLISNFTFGQAYPNLQFVHGLWPDKDNHIYIPGREFVYDYTITNSEGREFKATKDSIGLKPATAERDVVKTIRLAVVKSKWFQRTNSGQTEIVYSCEPNPHSFSATGVVENRKNIWIHPPRSDFFRILETCPFPYVKLPVETGKTWSDQIAPGEWWGSPVWMEWEGPLLFNLTYTITGNRMVDTEAGSFRCWVIEGKGTSEKGDTQLTSYFNEDVGFVQLTYTTINHLTINLKLKQVTQSKPVRGYKNYVMQKIDGN